jgi:N6-adenosine-specific RNA methylase IME4
MNVSYQVMPALSPDEFAELKADIRARGVMVPVEYDDQGEILDGHHRVRACRELGIAEWPRITRLGLDTIGKRLHARKLNLARRHLDQAQKRGLIEAQLRDTPGRSNRQIAGGLGVDHKTVGAVRDKLSGGEIPQLDRVTGSDGKIYPASRPTGYRFVDRSPEGRRGILAEAKEIRAEKDEQRRAARDEKLIELSRNNAPLRSDRRFPIVYSDPPWRYDHPYSAATKIENHYPTMADADICALPVADICTHDAMLFLWVPSPLLKKGMAVLEAWGFEYRTCAVWDKLTIGMGIYFRQQHELLLLASRGKSIVPDPAQLSPSVVSIPRGEHSAKPAAFHELIERMYPTLPKIELFARSRRDGWEAWGNEAPIPMRNNEEGGAA